MDQNDANALDGAGEGTPSTDGGSVRRSRWSLVAVVAVGTTVVLALALTIVVGSSLREDLPRAAPGEILVPPTQADIASTAGTISLPWRQMSLTVGTPKDELPEVLRDESLVAPPEDGSFVPVDLQPAEGGPPPFVSQGKPWRAEAEIVLIADGTKYPLDGPDGLGVGAAATTNPGSFSRWVAVEGHPTDVAVTVTVDGEQQRVDTDGNVERGKAARLRGLPSAQDLLEAESSSCGTPDRAGSSTTTVEHSDLPGCELAGSLRVPFVDGLGWAAKGKEYLVVQATTDDWVSFSGEGDEPLTTTTRVTARLGRASPEAGPQQIGGSSLGVSAGGNSHQFIFEVPAGEATADLTLRLDVETTPSDPFASATTPRGRLEWTIPAQELS